MGKSNACFRLITCGGHSDVKDADDLQDSESKCSRDKRGWGIRKKSSHNCSLSSTVTSATTASGKEVLGSTIPKSKVLETSADPEKKISVQPVEENIQTPPPSKVCVDEDVMKYEKERNLQDDEEVDPTPNYKEVRFVGAEDQAREDEQTRDSIMNYSEVEANNVGGKVIDASSTGQKEELVVEDQADNFARNDKEVETNRTDEKSGNSISNGGLNDCSETEKGMDFQVDEKAGNCVRNTAIEICDAKGEEMEEIEEDDLKGNMESEIDYLLKKEEIDQNDDVQLDASLVIFIQAHVRQFLAQRELKKRQKVVKLQAVVRGHLVRMHAVGALHCVQAIVKMQALVRARQARISLEHDGESSASWDKKSMGERPKAMSVSADKLLKNGFARQLLHTTSAKPIRMKCDTSKPNSAWNWLERWVSVSTPEKNVESKKLAEQVEGEENKIATSPEISLDLPSEVTDSDIVRINSIPTEVDLYKVEKDNFQETQTIDLSTLSHRACEPIVTNMTSEIIDSNQNQTNLTSEIIDSNQNQTIVSADDSQNDGDPLSKQQRSGYETDELNPSIESQTSQGVAMQGKSSISVSGKASNPSFIAAQLKFEEFSAANSVKSVITLRQNPEVEIKVDEGSPVADTNSGKSMHQDAKVEFKSDEVSPVVDARIDKSSESKIGNEFSVSPTLDSSETLENGAFKYEQEVLSSSLSNEKGDTDSKESRLHGEKSHVDIGEAYAKNGARMSHGAVDGEEKVDPQVKDALNSSTVMPYECIPEETEASVKVELQHDMEHEVQGMLSPEATSRSAQPVPESQATPSSQASGKSKKDGTEKPTSSRKKKSLSASKTSPSNVKQKISDPEQPSKDQKTAKRRNSFGSARSENVGQEATRDNDNSGPLPRFMQATESARAKINAGGSPRSSPDSHEKDYIKKRRSLSGGTGRQASPLVQRSIPQTQQERRWLK